MNSNHGLGFLSCRFIYLYFILLIPLPKNKVRRQQDDPVTKLRNIN